MKPGPAWQRPLARRAGRSGRLDVGNATLSRIFSAQLVNGPFGDPGLYLDFRCQQRALLFDLGDLAALAPKRLLRVSEVFVSHTHMDHFIGFDRLVRVCLGRERGLRLYGPPGFVAQVGHRLAGYTWNLVENYPNDFSLEVWEVDPRWRARGARLRSHRRFEPEALPERALPEGVLLEEEAFCVRAAFLDHRTACLAFAVEERDQVNVLPERLAALGLGVGPWLKELKRAVLAGAPDDTAIRARWNEGGSARERVLRLGELRRELLCVTPGTRIAYVTDLSYHEENARRAAALAADAELLFIECVFLERDAEQAARKCHLTARQAGAIARAARARGAVPFHFSPRYTERERELRAEFEAARAAG